MRPWPILGATTAMTIHDFSARLGTGEERPLTRYRGKLLLIVNVASKCGFTPRYRGLQRHYERFQPRRLWPGKHIRRTAVALKMTPYFDAAPE